MSGTSEREVEREVEREGEDAVEQLDLRGRLPHGLSAVEASAGTGKTYALTALAVQGVVLDGLRPDELLVVTFTRAAAKQLRGRIRAGMRDAAVALRALAATGAVPVGLDDWLDALCRDSGGPGDPAPAPDEARRRAAAAARALSSLDRATITTLHGFCQEALSGLGLRGAVGGARIATDVTRLRRDVVRDRLLTVLAEDPRALRRAKGRAADGDAALEGPPAVERRIDGLVRAVLGSDAAVAPIGPSSDPLVDATAELARSVVDELRGRLEVDDMLTFDELVRRVDLTLADPQAGPAAARQLRARKRLVLIDEMQDTDAAQWRIIERAFLADPASLGPASDVVIVGDPKQSIYRFRGADIDAYLAASSQAGEQRRTLASNWRSAAPLLDALDVLLRGARFGSERIAYRRVAPGRPVDVRVTGTGAPLELRWIARDGTLPLAKNGRDLIADDAQARLLDDLAARVVGMLAVGRIVASDAERADPTVAVADDGTRALAPRDVAVLVRKNSQAVAVVERLATAGVPAVQPKGGDVYDTEAFTQWRVLLAALARPSDTDLVRALVLSWFVDEPVAAVDDEARIDVLQQSCAVWASTLAAGGMLALLAELRADPPVMAALARAGERGLTDVEHLAELVHVAAGARGVPPAVALRVLEDLSLASDVGEDDTDDPAVRRIGSDGDAAQVMTYHGAKGLEFPVVLVPFANRVESLRQPWEFRSPAGRVVDAGSTLAWRPVEQDGTPSPDAPHATKQVRDALARAAMAGDEARLLYVALTRARDRCLVWWWPAQHASSSTLATLLFGARDAGGALEPGAAAPAAEELDDDVVRERLAGLAARAHGTVEIVEVPAAPADVRYVPPSTAARGEPAVATSARDVHEPDVWRWSFTGLLRTTPGAIRPADDAATSATGGTDEPEAADTPMRAVEAGPVTAGTQGPLVDLPGGTSFGVLVHEALEAVDLAAGTEALRTALAHELTLRATRAAIPVDVARLTDGLVAALATPLDPLLAGVALRDVPARDRVPELVFELPVADTHERVALRELAHAVADALDADDPYRTAFATLPERVERVRFAGWLTGVVDLALRAPDGRYVVADYKTNRLRDATGVHAYDAAAMHAAMLHGEYPLQALLYLVGMHRMLGRRLAGYDPAQHLGGAAFLFVRGMVGPDTPLRDGVRDGVSVWRPAIGAVLAADAVLAGAAADAGRRVTGPSGGAR